MATKVSVVIPNYKGKNILSKNLPEVVKNCPDCEIIVVDDASQDGSPSFLKENFPKIKTLVLPKNKGFAGAVNSGVKVAKGEYVLLLNSDVSPRQNFLKPLLGHFQKNEKLFAVGIKDISHEEKKDLQKGRGGATFSRGFVVHYPLTIEKGETLWVSGGSGLFNKKLFLKLGGFDQIYAPFYWEDIDLSYRARKMGYSCIFEPKSVVDHYHEEGAIKRQNKQSYVKAVSYKNQFIFVWRNISDYSLLISHIVWLPYHFLKALFSGDWPFFLGFFKAALQIPQLILNYQSEAVVSDKEIFKKFEKQ